MQSKPSMLRDMTAGIVVLIALALPLLPLTGGPARMKVHFRAIDDDKPHAITTRTSASVCTVMAATLAYRDPDTGAFTEVNCQE